jgi:hypothetical protein
MVISNAVGQWRYYACFFGYAKNRWCMMIATRNVGHLFHIHGEGSYFKR